MVETISPALARRVALAAQGFGRVPDARPGTRQFNLLLRRLGLLQIDSVNVYERSHYQPVFARLGGYDKALLDRLTYGKGVTEYWAHEASFLPVETLPLMDWRKAHYREWYRTHPESWGASNEKTIEWLRAELAEKGPLRASEIEHESNVRQGPWWGWSDVKRGLETMFRQGDVVSAGRTRFERVYALPEQVLPAEVLNASVSRDDAIAELMSISARAHGIGTLTDLADYFRLKRVDAQPAIDRLVESGELLPVTVPGWGKPAWLHRDARLPRRLEAAALLSPFDPVVWERARALRLFDFHYRIEIYTPAPKRVFGYYVLPVLIDDRIPARLDLKSDRQAGVLRVQSAWAEPGLVPDDIPRIADLLRSAAAWQGLPGDILVADRGTLAPALRAELS
ncbi:crosslink repair DNA glycosylase YcaQ family protein [Herbiconiux sp. KACC 21604]|uniref:winged helix-turn-helix domain-containing protein n=1 Tax=unclassified Herbiconiux TaxID=2618217 RepID=UPI0014929AB4|nr:crosslink repair DNA glycosylase YcaQ family protein [Herbiconiux sp. SALV-R1]QJU56035.1 winged helix-turn-helix domain-containing protein [Herbiconiux sp. SALV-R1]WPO88719.1 crosslink repair DNA glycosylase YcaQ family protein [Herbiconiux sp. KACC 21604]